MRKLRWVIWGFWLGGRLLAAGADSFQLADGATLAGTIVKYDDTGAMIRTMEDIYTNVTWTRFSQDTLKQLAQNPKIKTFVNPFILPPPEPRPKEEIKIREVSRLAKPPAASLFAALFSSPVGLVVMFLIYGANLYAAMEIAIFRARPVGVVMGVAAALPIVGPIIFLSLPTQVETLGELVAEAEAETGEAPAAVAAPTQPAGGIRIAAASWQQAAVSPENVPAQIFKRGQFVFNRRFFETKFPGFFGLVRREADKDMVLHVRTPRGNYEVNRITRIAANDLHFEVLQGAARQEVMVPFGEIQEIQLKHKNA